MNANTVTTRQANNLLACINSKRQNRELLACIEKSPQKETRNRVVFDPYGDEFPDEYLVVINYQANGHVEKSNGKYLFYRERNPDDERPHAYLAFYYEDEPYITTKSLLEMKMVLSSLNTTELDAPRQLHR